MQVLKFGGTSVANAENIKKVIAIVSDTIKKENTIVVVSALGGVTDLLLDAAVMAASGNPDYIQKIELIEERHRACIEALYVDLNVQQLNKTDVELIYFIEK